MGKYYQPPDTVESAPENTPATKKPGKPEQKKERAKVLRNHKDLFSKKKKKRIKCTEPGRWPRMSITKRGRSWSLVDTRPDVIGSQ